MRFFPHLDHPLFLDGYAMTSVLSPKKVKNAADLQGARHELLSLSKGILGVHDRKRCRFSTWNVPILGRILSGKTYADRVWLTPDGQMVRAWFGDSARLEVGPMVHWVDELRIESGKESKFAFSPLGMSVDLGTQAVERVGSTHPDGSFAFCDKGMFYIGKIGTTVEMIASGPCQVPEGATVEFWAGPGDGVLLALAQGECRGWWSSGQKFAFAADTLPIRRDQTLIYRLKDDLTSYDLATGQMTALSKIPVGSTPVVGGQSIYTLSQDREDLLPLQGPPLPRKLSAAQLPIRQMVRARVDLAQKVGAPDHAQFWDCHLQKDSDALDLGIGCMLPPYTFRTLVAKQIVDSRTSLAFDLSLGIRRVSSTGSDDFSLPKNRPLVNRADVEGVFADVGGPAEIKWMLMPSTQADFTPDAALRLLGMFLVHFLGPETPLTKAHVDSFFPGFSDLLDENRHLKQEYHTDWITSTQKLIQTPPPAIYHRVLSAALVPLLKQATGIELQIAE